MTGELDRHVLGELSHIVLRDLHTARMFEGAQVYASVAGVPRLDLAFGRAGGDRSLTPQSLVPWMCASKLLGAVAMAQLSAQARVNEAMSIASALDRDDVPIEYTIGDLLRHRILWASEPPLTGMFWPDEGELAARALERLKLEHPERGAELCRYSIWRNWALLAAIVHRVTGERFADYCRTAVLLPAGAARSWIGMDAGTFEAIEPDISYLFSSEGEPQQVPFIGSRQACTRSCAGTGGIGPIRELARVYEAVLDGVFGADLLPTLLAPGASSSPVGLPKLALEWGLGVLKTVHALGSDSLGPNTFGQGAQDLTISFADVDSGVVICVWFNGIRTRALSISRARTVATAILADIRNEKLT